MSLMLKMFYQNVYVDNISQCVPRLIKLPVKLTKYLLKKRLNSQISSNLRNYITAKFKNICFIKGYVWRKSRNAHTDNQSHSPFVVQSHNIQMYIARLNDHLDNCHLLQEIIVMKPGYIISRAALKTTGKSMLQLKNETTVSAPQFCTIYHVQEDWFVKLCLLLTWKSGVRMKVLIYLEISSMLYYFSILIL